MEHRERSPLPDRVVAVIVSFNRRELLGEVLDAIAAQTRRPDVVLVIDNHSEDGSAELARAHPLRPEVVELTANIGGAGGFCAGLALAIGEHRAESVWLMDDDTVPEPGALAGLLDARERAEMPLAIIASRVLWTDGRDHPMNTPRHRFAAPRAFESVAAKVGGIPIRSASFVSMLVDAAAVRREGLPIADYFLWNDDFEFSARLLRRRAGVWVDSSRVEHRTKVFGDTDADPGARFYYEVRNKLWLFTRARALNVWEYPLFGYSTLRRWARTIAKSSNRGLLLSSGAKGLLAALTTAPRTNREVLAAVLPQVRTGAPEALDAVNLNAVNLDAVN